ncbi:hypothetical protein ACLKA6_014829 [Drosophila palustris]
MVRPLIINKGKTLAKKKALTLNGSAEPLPWPTGSWKWFLLGETTTATTTPPTSQQQHPSSGTSTRVTPFEVPAQAQSTKQFYYLICNTNANNGSTKTTTMFMMMMSATWTWRQFQSGRPFTQQSPTESPDQRQTVRKATFNQRLGHDFQDLV